MFKRIFLFAITNIAILLVLSVIMAILSKVFGVNLSGNTYTGMFITSLIIGFVGAFISLAISRWSAKRAYSIILIDETNKTKASEKELKVYALVESLAQRNFIKMPEVGVYVSSEPNAFATGRSKNASLVAVSTGLLENFTIDEIEGVIAHEMAHILNGDMVTMTLLQGVLNTFVIFFSKIIARAIDEYTDGKLGWIGYNAVYMLLQVVLGMGATLIAMKFSRYREYRADLGSAQSVGKAKMIAGLRRLQTLESAMHPAKESSLAAFQIATDEKVSLFASHPSLESRIKALEENYTLA